MKGLYLLLVFAVSSSYFGQYPVSYTPGIDQLANEKINDSLSNLSMFNNYPIYNIGLTVFNGRIEDVDVNPTAPSEFYTAHAFGDHWYTKNNGSTFEPIFDNNEVVAVGDISVDGEIGHIWVATSEVNNTHSHTLPLKLGFCSV